MIIELLGPRWTSFLLDLGVALFLFSFVWGMVKASYQRVTGSPMPRKWYTLLLDVLADLAINVPGAINRVQPGLFWEPTHKLPERVVSNNQERTVENESKE